MKPREGGAHAAYRRPRRPVADCCRVVPSPRQRSHRGAYREVLMPIQHVGRPLKRLEDPKLITGSDPYVNDVRRGLEGALWLAFTRSPHAHAVIKRIDTTAARKMPGVVAVLTGADVNAEVGVIHTPLPPEMFQTMNRQGHTLLAEGRVRHVGEPVVVVAAESPQAATDAADAVVVDYEPLPVVVDAQEALKPGAPLLYPETGSNLAVSLKIEKAGVDAGLAAADVILELDMMNQRVLPLCMEPRACSAIWDDKAQKLTMWGDTQTPHRMRDHIAERLQLKPEQIHLRTGRVGGGFGAKVPVYQEDTLVPMLARRLKRPVRWAATRREDMQSTGHGRDMRCWMKLGADKFPYDTALGNSYDSGEYARALDHALAKSGYPALRKEQEAARAQGRLVGIGLASYVEICGFEDDEVSDLVVADDGRVTVLTGSASHGQGHETAFAQLVADELQVPMDMVKIVQGDTALVRNGVGTFGSRSAARGGMHALGNATKVREKAQQIAANLLEAAAPDLVLADGRFSVRGVPDRSVTWQQVAAAAKGSLHSKEDLQTGNGMLFPFGAHVAMVEVDRDTGQPRILRYMSVDDAGFLINPLLVQGQVHGGLAQGIGQALWEEAAFDEGGQLLSSSLMDYALPKTIDLISFDNDHTRTHSPRTPLGVKGIGEAATIGSTPAIANAVMDALAPVGVTHVDLPLTPRKIWAAMSAARKS